MVNATVSKPSARALKAQSTVRALLGKWGVHSLKKDSKHVAAGDSKHCPQCNVTKDVSEYGKDNDAKDGLARQCRACRSKYAQQYGNTAGGFLQKLLGTARSSTTKREMLGRNHEFTLTIDELKAKWMKQDGRCAITSMPMVLKPHSNFKCSIERIDNNLGYTDGNTTLIISECNTASQWTVEKAQHLFADTVHDALDLTTELQVPKRPQKGQKKWIADADGNVFCHYCNVKKTIEEFRKTLSHGCKTCANQRDRTRHDTWRVVLQRIFYHMEQHAKRRKMECPITFEELLSILSRQGGLCYYSRKAMSPSLGPFRVSAERLNVMETYTVSNTVLICQEFNSSDHTRVKTEHSNDGSAGWSIEKYQAVRNIFNAHKEGL